MKKIILSLLFCEICALAYGQSKLFQTPYHPLNARATIGEFLKDINDRTGVILEYSSKSFDADKVVQLKGDEATVGAVLQAILTGQHVRPVVHNHKIMLAPSSGPFISINGSLPEYNFYGYVKARESGEPLINAALYEPATHSGVLTNDQGYFNFKLSEGVHIIRVSYAGMEPDTLNLTVKGNMRKDVALAISKGMLATVVVRSDPRINDGSIKIRHSQVLSENLINESDPLQYLYLYPGLQNASYSFNAFQVRGGGMDENLFLLDGNRVYNPTHLLGAISIINPTVLKAMRLYKSDFPASLGGSLSSVLEVLTRQGNMNDWEGEVDAGLLAGSAMLEGPLVKNKVSLMVSGRKGYTLPFYQNLQDGMKTDFYDLHLRLSAILSKRNKLAVNLYKGEDKIIQSGKYIYNLHKWGNTVGSVNWNLLLGSRSFINTSVNFSEYRDLGSFQYTLFEKDTDADTDFEEDSNDIDSEEDISLDTKYIGTFSSLKNYNVKSRAEIYASPNLKLNTGVELSQISITPFDGKITSGKDDDEDDFETSDPMRLETLTLYGEAEMKLGNKFFIKPGLRAAAYQFGNYRTLTFQPRFYMVFHITPFHKIYASYSKLNQFLHRVTNPYAGANRDIWAPSTAYLIPELSRIYDVGYAFRHWPDFKFSIEGYYKQLVHVTNYAEGTSTFINGNDWEQGVDLGKGRSYGAEIMAQRTGDKFSWQLGYALSWSWRQFNTINDGKEFPYKYDHRHALNAGASYSINQHIEVSALWSFSTGNVYSMGGLVMVDSVQQAPLGEDPLQDYRFLYHYSQQDQYRAKSYQRYDLSVTYHSRKDRKLYSMIKAGVYNINGTADQYSYNVRGALNTKSIHIKTGTSTFSVIPYLSYTLKF